MYYVTKLQGNPLFKITLNEAPCLQPVLQTVNGLVCTHGAKDTKQC